MRISDWSSDVCSSDLQPAAVDVRLRQVEHVPARLDQPQRPPEHGQQHVGRADEEQQQIGRASCRERVLSVRVDLGGRRIIKNKKYENTLLDTPRANITSINKSNIQC